MQYIKTSDEDMNDLTFQKMMEKKKMKKKNLQLQYSWNDQKWL